MDNLKVSSEFSFSETEEKLITSKVNQIIDILTDGKTAYAQAVEALERSKIEIKKSFLIRL